MSTADSFRRTYTLIGCVVVALSAGTNYVYSAYAPQLGHRLGLNHAQLNVIGFGGNAGNYLAGPFWGRAVDSQGPRLLLLSSFVCLLTGYAAIRAFYEKQFSLPTTTTTTLTPAVVAIAFLQFVTGVGGNAGITAALNTTAKSFPDSSRASVTGLVISGFGLSAFLFSGIAHLAFPGNTSDFLLLLAFGTAIPPMIGSFFLRAVPHPERPDEVEPIIAGGPGAAVEAFSAIQGPNVYERLDDYEESEVIFDEEASQPVYDAVVSSSRHRNSSSVSGSAPQRSPVLEFSTFSDIEPAMQRSMSKESGLSRFKRNSLYIATESRPGPLELRTSQAERNDSIETSGETEGLLSPSHKRIASASRTLVSHPDIHGMALIKSGDFWLIFAILSLLSGTGLMWINNVGSITQALYIKGTGGWDEVQGSKEQAFQVSITSLGNCFGRVLIGLTADFIRNRLQAPRVLLCTFISVSFILSQIVAQHIEGVENLWAASVMVGLSYGAVFGLFPVITIEWFGLGRFSQNWGFVSLAPVISGNLFSLAFGRNLDSHASNGKSPSPPAGTSMLMALLSRRGGVPSELICVEGRVCYSDSLKMTTGACIAALGLSFFAVYRDARRTKKTRVTRQVAWDDEGNLIEAEPSEHQPR